MTLRPTGLTLIAFALCLGPQPAWSQADAPQTNALADEAAARRQAGIPEEARKAAQQALQATLSEIIVLRYQVQQAHWNVVGEEFYQLHDMTGDFYKALGEYVDVLAEQKLTRGAPASALSPDIHKAANLPALPAGYISGAQLISSLSESYAIVSKRLNQRIGQLGQKDDLGSQDLLIGLSSLIDKQLWMLRAHSQVAE
ncbi:MAG: Dps family protein [Alphaproteobacteria bacterium]